MGDQILKALQQPTNMVMISTRWPNGNWQIRNLSIGSTEIYPQLGFADRYLDELQREADREILYGAVASEIKILRATFEDIEFICSGRR